MSAVQVQAVPHSDGFLFPRQAEPRGLVGWLTTVDHKRIGILYGLTSFLWLLVGGFEALLIRTQLAVPNNAVVSPETFNQLFTMHGTTMIFLVVMPMSAAFFNFLIPLMIGARDVAFPRLNAFSYWMFFFGGVFLNSSWFLGGAPNGGWFGYANLTMRGYTPGHGVDFWVMGLLLLGVSSLVAALNFITTILNMRAPGMNLMRMPVFVWMSLVTQFLILFAFPSITIALIEVLFDRNFGTNFFNPAAGGLPILYQHLFWIFGHPEVYILILPAMGIVSEILPTFARKPLFGYPVVVFSGAAIGFMGFTVWSHHMFTTGMGPVANSAFALTTMAIAVPTGVKIFNWLGTLWGGQIRFRVPLLFALGFVSQFMIGGFSGLMHASPPHDAQQQDTYFIVAHFHYVLIGGALFGIFAGLYYWFPKAFGRGLSEAAGRWVFGLLFVGFNLTFFPMHYLGLNGMPRRIPTYPDGMGWNELNFASTTGAYIMGFAILIFAGDVVRSLRRSPDAPGDPWDGRTLEWSIPSPPPEWNFDRTPVVRYRDDFWAAKHPETVHGEDAGEHAPGIHAHEHIHLPGPSWFPLLASFGLLLFGYGMVFGGPVVVQHSTNPAVAFGYFVLAVVSARPLAAFGFLFAMFWFYCWAFEPIGGRHIDLKEHA